MRCAILCGFPLVPRPVPNSPNTKVSWSDMAGVTWHRGGRADFSKAGEEDFAETPA